MTSTRQPEPAYIIGSDEVGYGCWAGPLVVCATCVPATWTPPTGLTDSKKLSHETRVALYHELEKIPFQLVAADNECIDRLGVKTMLLEAHAMAIKMMQQRWPLATVIVDGILRPPGMLMARCIPEADAIFPAVSAASVIAKVNRDYLMRQYHKQYPYYGFDHNVGYGTGAHTHGLKKHGVCPLHRRSYRPIKALLEATCT